MKGKLRNIIPAYAIAPVIVCISLNILSFYLTRLLNGSFRHNNIAFSIDDKIPFIPFFILFYVGAYIQWFIGYIKTAGDDKDLCYSVFSSLAIAKIICAAFFVLFPTAMTRPEISGTDIFSRLTAFIYSVDAPDNLYPSIHCLESFIFTYSAIISKKTGPAGKAANIVFTLLVFASVVLVKQHLFADIIGGIIVGILSLYISKITKAKNVFYMLEKRMLSPKEKTD